MLLDQRDESLKQELEQQKNQCAALLHQIREKSDKCLILEGKVKQLEEQLAQKEQAFNAMKSINQDLVSQLANISQNTDYSYYPKTMGSYKITDSSQIHNLYQNLYVTDLKDQIQQTCQKLASEQRQTHSLGSLVGKYKNELQSCKRVLKQYRALTKENQ